MEVVLVVANQTALSRSLQDVMAREALSVVVTNADVLRQPPMPVVHVFVVDASLALAFANPIVAWANTAKRPPGLVGVVEGGSGHEREELLAAGFDDAVSDPSARETVARIRAVHRRMGATVTSDRLRYGAFTLDVREHLLRVGSHAVTLTAIELAVMRELIKAAGRALSRGDLLDVAWGVTELETNERAVDNVILRLRRKLPTPDAIETVRGVGFRLSRSAR